MKIGIVGCAGRMGQMLVREIITTTGCTLSGGTESPSHPTLGLDIGAFVGQDPCGLSIQDDAEALFQTSEVVIDFTTPTITKKHVDLAVRNNTKLIMGTTGHNEKELSAIRVAAENVVIVKAMNFSIGINMLLSLTQKLAETLDDTFDIEVVEMHHKDKVDAPSGTAIWLGEAAARGRQVSLTDVAQYNRMGPANERKKGNIGFASLRGGDIVGEHRVIFAGSSERIELGHIASSRKLFSKGAIRAAFWSSDRQPGLYDMLDVLNLN